MRYPRQNTLGNVSISTDPNDSLRRVVYVAEFLSVYTQRILFEILLNRPEIGFYLPFSNEFGSKRTSVKIQISGKIVNTILLRVDLIKFRKKSSRSVAVQIVKRDH